MFARQPMGWRQDMSQWRVVREPVCGLPHGSDGICRALKAAVGTRRIDREEVGGS